MSRAGFITAVAALALAHSAWAQAPGAEREREDARSVLAAEIAEVEGAIAALEDLIAWQNEMTRAASSDPAGTLQQRRPMSECRASPLAPVCASLAALFRDDAPAGTGTEPGEAVSDAEWEGAP